MNIVALLHSTRFEQQAACIAATFANFGIDSLAGVENAPGIVRQDVCGVSVHEVSLVLAEQLRLSARADKLAGVRGIGPEIALALVRVGIFSIEDLRRADDRLLLSVPGIGRGVLAKIRRQIGG